MRLVIHQFKGDPVIYEDLTEPEALAILEEWSKKNYLRISQMKDCTVTVTALSIELIPEWD